MTKKFVTIFPICENVHLTKDLGQIPYFFHKEHHYDSYMVCYKNSEVYSNLETEVNGLKIEFLRNTGKISFLEKGVLRYIYDNAKKIDVLNLFHFSKQSFAYGLLYKQLNPNGFLYIKIDGYNDAFAEGTRFRHSISQLKNHFLSKLEQLCLDKTDLLSIENTEGERLLKLMYPQYQSKIIYSPVGVNDYFLDTHFKDKLKTFEQKENIILTTGRIGLNIKNHEMLLRAVARVDLNDWKVVFVGPLYPGFMDFFNKLLVEHPRLKNKVIFTGQINNRVELYEWYNRAKIFCMTSWKESFSLSIAEAIYFGNYVIGTEGVMSMNDVTDKGRLGAIIKPDDDKAFAACIQKHINNESELKSLFPEILNHSRNNFVWKKIIGKLALKIN